MTNLPLTSTQTNSIPNPFSEINLAIPPQIEEPIQIPPPLFRVDPNFIPIGMVGTPLPASPYIAPSTLSQRRMAPAPAPIPNFAELTSSISESHPHISKILKANSQNQIRIANTFSLNTSALSSVPSSHTYM